MKFRFQKIVLPRTHLLVLGLVAFGLLLISWASIIYLDLVRSRFGFQEDVTEQVKVLEHKLRDNVHTLDSVSALALQVPFDNKALWYPYVNEIKRLLPQLLNVVLIEVRSGVGLAGGLTLKQILDQGISLDVERSETVAGNKNLLTLPQLQLWFDQEKNTAVLGASPLVQYHGRMVYLLAKKMYLPSKKAHPSYKVVFLVIGVDELLVPVRVRMRPYDQMDFRYQGQVVSVHGTKIRAATVVKGLQGVFRHSQYTIRFSAPQQAFELNLSRPFFYRELPGSVLMFAAGLVLLFYTMVIYIVNLRYCGARARSEAREHLRQERERSQALLHLVDDAVVITNAQWLVEYVNPVAASMLNLPALEIIGERLNKVVNFYGETGELVDLGALFPCVGANGHCPLPEKLILRVLGRISRPVSGSISAIKKAAEDSQGIVLVFRDIGEAIRLAEELRFRATHDDITALFGRKEFERRLQLAIERVGIQRRPSVLMYMDLDQFKIVNDTCGHRVGDQLLKNVAELLTQVIRATDVLARFGGDEFALLLEDCGLDDAKFIAEKINTTIKSYRFKWKSKIFDVAISLGLVEITSTDLSVEQAMSLADSACYLAKEQGRNRFHVYTLDDGAMIKHRGEMEWLQRINQAYADNRFELYIQEIMLVRADSSNTSRHFEVLLRMLDEQNNVILPMAYIMAAERYDKMTELDRWVIKNAFSLINTSLECARSEPLYFSINLSGQSLSDESTIQFVATQIALYPGIGKHIVFEITETAAISNLAQARRFVSHMRTLACRFSLDDFGSGLSSFSYLKNLPVDYLKIDGQFIKDIALGDPVNYALAYSINQVGHALGIKTVAEYVESKAILEKLLELGVDYAQGNWLSAPKRFKNHPLLSAEVVVPKPVDRIA